MGEVYRATDLILKRVVAIKLLPAGFAGRDIQRLQREARVLGSLSHAHLVQIFDFGSSNDGRPYLVMEFLRGQDLESLIAGSQLAFSRLREIALQILEGLAYMHSQGVVHRDLKPSNILLAANENSEEIVKIIDFGLARLEAATVNNQEYQQPDREGQKLTRSGSAVGSPFYMSPEQVRGEAPDSRSDIYAFGCLLFAMVAGRPPFVSDNPMATFEMHLKMTPPSLEQVTGEKYPDGFEDLIVKCLEKDPRNRFQSILELREAFISIDFDPSEITDPEPQKKSGRLILPVSALLSLLLIASLALWYLKAGPEKSETKVRKHILPEEERTPVLFDKHYFGGKGGKGGKKNEGYSFDEERGKQKYVQVKVPLMASDDEIEASAKAPRIDRLILNNTNTDGKVLKKFAHLRISRVDMRNTFLDEDGARSLLRLPAIEELDIVGCENLSDAGLATIASIPGLTGLTLGSGRVTARSFSSLKGAQNLENITLSFHGIPVPGGFAASLAGLPRLRFFGYLSCDKLAPSNISELRGLPHLEILALMKAELNRDILAQAARLPVSILNLRDCTIEKGALLKLRSSSSLQAVDLTNCRHKDDTGLVEDIEALRETDPGFAIDVNGIRFSASQPAR